MNKKNEVTGLLFIVARFFFEPLIICYLWNWLEPDLFPTLPLLGYWQAMAINVICNIIVGKGNPKKTTIDLNKVGKGNPKKTTIDLNKE